MRARAYAHRHRHGAPSRIAAVVGLVTAATTIVIVGAAAAFGVNRAAGPSPTPPDSATAAGDFGRFGAPLSVNPYNHAAEQIQKQHSTADARDITLLKRIANQPQADWFVGSTSVADAVQSRVDLAAKQNSIAQLVVYNLPNRDCGGYSANSITTGDEYKLWFNTFLQGLGSHRAIVVIEPDALAQTECLTAAQRADRFGLIAWTVDQLRAQGSWSYIDAGNSGWLTAHDAAARLKLAGVAHATGFSLNVSNFQSNAGLIQYGTAISKLTNGRHFIIDTSRNGVEISDTNSCNPPGTGLGHAPTEVTGYKLVDAFLWIKTPGDSDGSCNGAPVAGGWFQAYAITLARNANLG